MGSHRCFQFQLRTVEYLLKLADFYLLFFQIYLKISVLSRNQLIALWGFPLYKTLCFFSPAAFRNLFINLRHFNYDISGCGSVWASLS